jgi:hypothetical protein
VSLIESDRHLTTFITPWGHLQVPHRTPGIYLLRGRHFVMVQRRSRELHTGCGMARSMRTKRHHIESRQVRLRAGHG